MDSTIIAKHLVDECKGEFPAIAITNNIEIEPTSNGFVMSLDDGMNFDGISAYQIAVVVVPVAIATAAKLKKIKASIRKKSTSETYEIIFEFYSYNELTKQLLRLVPDMLKGIGNEGDS